MAGIAGLVYCLKCKRHSLGKNINQDHFGEEKVFLRAPSSILEKLLTLTSVSSGANNIEIAVTLLSRYPTIACSITSSLISIVSE